MCWVYFETIGHSLKNCPPLRKIFSPPAVPSWLRPGSPANENFPSSLLRHYQIPECFYAKKAVFELVTQLYHATEIANVANAVSACANQP